MKPEQRGLNLGKVLFMKMKITSLAVVSFIAFQIAAGCASTPTQASSRDIVHDPFPEAKEEVRATMLKIHQDVVTGKVGTLRSHHLNSPKFSKFGPRKHERQTFEETSESEASFFTSITDFTVDAKDMKVDVFGDVAVMTYYPQVTFKKDGKKMKGNGRQTVVFVKTTEGWLIARVTYGKPWLDGATDDRHTSGKVILLEAEDDVPTTIKPRLGVAGTTPS